MFQKVFPEEKPASSEPTRTIPKTEKAGRQEGGGVSAAAGASPRRRGTSSASASPSHLLEIPAGAGAARVELSLTLLLILSHPFGDPANRDSAEPSLRHHWLADPTRQEYPQMVERLDWDYESSIQFRWDFSKLILPSLNLAGGAGGAGGGGPGVMGLGLGPAGQQLNWFVGSDQPSGWTSEGSSTGY
jgi:hypothetical protein